MSENPTAPNAPSRTRKPRRDWKPIFLKAFADSGTIVAACDVARVNRSTVFRARQADETFALAWADIDSSITDQLETKAVEMALNGDTRMMEFLLKARRPDVYRENVRIEHAGKVRTDVSLPTEAEWHKQVASVLLEAGAFVGASIVNGNGNGNGHRPDQN